MNNLFENIPRDLPEELFDLESDPLVMTNLVGDEAHADTKTQLKSELARWMVATKDPLLDGHPVSPLYKENMAAIKKLAESE